MKESNKQQIRKKMLQELYDFIRQKKRLPKMKECNDKRYFSYGYGSYRRIFGSWQSALKQCGIDTLPKRKRSLRKETLYNRNLMSGKIRTLLRKDPDATKEDLEKTCGAMSRSIIVTYYRIYRELYNKTGSFRKAEYTKLASYLAKHPDHTINDIAEAFHKSTFWAHKRIHELQEAGVSVSYRLPPRKNMERGKALQIRQYFIEHPTASLQECANFVGVTKQYVSSIKWSAKKSGKLSYGN